MPTKPARKWSQKVTEHSDALDLEHGVFAQKSPKKIAASLKESAEHSERRKSSPFRSAMSMLSFYVNRAGSSLSALQRKRLDDAKGELRKQFDRPEAPAAAKRVAAHVAKRRAKPAAAPKAAAKRSKKPTRP